MKNKKLIELHPYLLPRNVWTGKPLTNYDFTYTEYDCIDRGWQIGFGKFLLEDLREACLGTDFLYKLRFSQIKEKFGSLRMYDFGAPQEVRDVITKYEFISEHVCSQCGSPYACIVNDYGWYVTLCQHCWDKINKRRELNGCNVKTWDEVVGGRTVDLSTEYEVCSYSKGKETVTTYDISETVNKIKKDYEKRKRKLNKHSD